MKKLSVLLAACMLVGTLAGCGEKAPATSTPDVSTPSTSTPDVSTPVVDVTFEGPILLTSGGQSADYQMINSVMGKLEMDVTMNNLATSADLEGVETLVVVLGGSSKGLGAAGIDADGELARLDELLVAADAADISILVMHTGGEARRGDLSDKFIGPILPFADLAVIVETGDKDGLMAGICTDESIPTKMLTGMADLSTALPEIFA